MKILVTGFDPFGGESINPASEAVKKLPDFIQDTEIIKLIIPTVFHKSIEMIKKAILEENPDVILSVGQAGGRSSISVERIGINIDDARIADNEGNQYIDEAVFLDGPAAYFSTLPIKSMVNNIREKGIPANISNSAGTFVCNHVMYGVLHLCNTEFKGKRAGFIHIPFLPKQTLSKPSPSMSLDTIVEALIAAIEAIILNDSDIKLSDGKEF